MHHFHMPQFLRFILVGGSCALLGSALIFVGAHLLHWNYLLVTFLAFLTLNYIGYWLNRWFTFNTRSTPRTIGLLRYYLVMAFSLCVNLLTMSALVKGLKLDPAVSGLIMSVAFACLNYFGHTFWTFTSRP